MVNHLHFVCRELHTIPDIRVTIVKEYGRIPTFVCRELHTNPIHILFSKLQDVGKYLPAFVYRGLCTRRYFNLQ